MTPLEFVTALELVAVSSAAESTILALDEPPDRSSSPALVEASAWYHRLSEEDRKHLRYVLNEAAYEVAFGVLAVIDGVRTVEDSPDKGRFKLTFEKGGKLWDLNPGKGEMLHDLLAQPRATD